MKASPYEGGALLSADERYRYLLWRELNAGTLWKEGSGSICTFVMLNPSTADALHDDPTIRRCIGYARRWRYSRLEVVNLFAWRATDPLELLGADDPVGPQNDAQLSEAFERSQRIICGWGGKDQPKAFAELVRSRVAQLDLPRDVTALAFTKRGEPRHPLYLAAHLDPVPYAQQGDAAGAARG